MPRPAGHVGCCWWCNLFLLVALAISGSIGAVAQESRLLPSDWHYRVLQWLPPELDAQTLQEFLEELEWFSRHPIDLREVSVDALRGFPLLYPHEAETIKSYLELHPEENDFTVLAFVLGLPNVRTELLRPFFRLSDVGGSSLQGKRIRGEVVHRWAYAVPTVSFAPLGAQEVYKHAVGTPLQMQTRLQLDAIVGWRFAFKGSKRAGEPFFHAFHPEGYPYYSAYFEYRPLRYNRVQLVVGDFSVHYGTGQTVGSQLMNFQVLDPQYWGLRQRPLQGKLGYADNTVLRGAGFRWVPLKWLQYSLFVSAQPISVRYGGGAAQDSIVSIPVGPSYISKLQHEGRFNAWEYVFGGNLELTYKRFNGGVVFCYDHFSRPLAVSSSTSYRLDVGSQRNLRVGMYGSLYLGDWRLWTELTCSRLLRAEGVRPQCSAMAGILYSPSYTFSIGAQGYYYPERAGVRHAQGVVSRPQNRLGALAAMRWSPLEGYVLLLSCGYLRYPNSHKMRTQPKETWEGGFTISMQPSARYRIVVGYSFRPYQMVRSAKTEAMSTIRDIHTVKCDASALLWPELEFRFYGSYQKSRQRGGLEGNSGVVVSLDIIARLFSDRLRFYLRPAYFNSQGAGLRAMLYEPTPLYGTFMHRFSGRGWRFCAMCRYRPIYSLTLWFKADWNLYTRGYLGTLSKLEQCRRQHVNVSLQALYEF